MKLDESFAIDGSTEEVWALLREPEFVAECLPGVELESKSGDGEWYLGSISIQFGPTTARFRGRAAFTIDDSDRTGHISARGADGKGATKAAAEIDVSVTAGQGSTQVNVVGNVDVFGPLSSFASSGGLHVTRALLSDFASCVAGRVSHIDEGQTTPATATASVSAIRLIWVTVVGAIKEGWRRLLGN